MKVIAFVNMKGGVGKTTLSVNVADTLNRRHDKRVLLVDLDPQFNATQCLFTGEEYVERRKQGGFTIVDIFNDVPTQTVDAVNGVQEKAAVALEDIKPWRIRKGFDLIAGNLELFRLEMSGGQGRERRLKRYLEKTKASENYDYVIIDTPPTPSHFMNSALLASDYYLVPVKPEPLSRVGIDLLRGVIGRVSENQGLDLTCLGVVITLADARTIVLQDAIDFLDADPIWTGKRFKAVLPARTVVAREQGKQKMILDVGEYDSSRAIAQITNEFLQRLDDE
jgi:chromosome partitioning protein